MIKQFLRNLYYEQILKKRIARKTKSEFRSGSEINRNTRFEGRNLISVNSIVKDSSLGYASYVGKSSLIKMAKVGRYTSIGPYVKCVFGTHPTSVFVSTHPAFFSTMKQVGFSYTDTQLFEEFPAPLDPEGKYTIEIGNDVWVGAGATIIDGVRIGDGAVIAANALVNKDVEPFSIVGGVPAKHIKYRFTPGQIAILQRVAWWNKDPDWIRAHSKLFSDIEKFCANFDHGTEP